MSRTLVFSQLWFLRLLNYRTYNCQLNCFNLRSSAEICGEKFMSRKDGSAGVRPALPQFALPRFNDGSYWSRISSGLLTGPVPRTLASVIFPPLISCSSFSVIGRAPLLMSTRLLSFDILFLLSIVCASYESSLWSGLPAVLVTMTLRSVAPAPAVCSISSWES